MWRARARVIGGGPGAGKGGPADPTRVGAKSVIHGSAINTRLGTGQSCIGHNYLKLLDLTRLIPDHLLMDRTRPPILPPAKARASGSTSTSPRQSGPPSRLQASSGLSSTDTMASSPDQGDSPLVQSPAGERAPKSTANALKRAREPTPQSDTGSDDQPIEEQASEVPATKHNRANDDDVTKDLKYCHQ